MSCASIYRRALRVAHTMLHHLGPQGRVAGADPARVALVFSADSPSSLLHFVCSLTGCLLAGLIPVVASVSRHRGEADLARLSFLLGACGLQCAITDKKSRKILFDLLGASGPTTSAMWSSLDWILFQDLKKSSGPPLTGADTPYIEYYHIDDAVHGLTVLQSSAMEQCCAMEVCWSTSLRVQLIGEVIVAW